jgi:hypothetical protein
MRSSRRYRGARSLSVRERALTYSAESLLLRGILPMSWRSPETKYSSSCLGSFLRLTAICLAVTPTQRE